jgi:mannan endo-1,4-beta-mannosidase
MRKLTLFVPLFLLALIFEACATFLFWIKPSYIMVDGTQFVYKGTPYYYVGTNMWDGCYLGSPGMNGDRPRLVRELDELKSLGVMNLRVLGASEESDEPSSLKPVIQFKPGVYDDSLLGGLDFLLAEMDKRDMHAVVFLNDFWEWSGGMAQYNYWARIDSTGMTPSDTANNYIDYAASFYKNERAQKLYFNYISFLLTRKNHHDGYYYYEEPAVMAWELANEPRPGALGDTNYVGAYYRWIDTTAHFIHSIDPNHLVTTGSEGLAGSLMDSTIFLTAHASKYIDYLTFHLWPKNWGWFDAKDAAGTYPQTVANARHYIDQHIEFARALGKPIAMEEFGLPRDGELYAPGTPTTVRDQYYEMVLGLVYDSAAAGAPIAGVNFWAWGGEGRARHPDYRWQVGDPLMGDPPMEPQGLNSVFDVDTTTIAILRTKAEEMIALSDTGKVLLQFKVAAANK